MPSRPDLARAVYWLVIHSFSRYSAGNKRDLEQFREINVTQAKEFAYHHQMFDALETSAKDNTNIDEVFVRMAKVSVRRYK